MDALMSDFEGYTPVILRSEGGRKSKRRIHRLPSRPLCRKESGCKADHIPECSTPRRSRQYSRSYDGTPCIYSVVVGSTAEFNKFAHVLKVLKESADTDNGDARSHIAVFGYPDWAAFRGDALTCCTRSKPPIYSRF